MVDSVFKFHQKDNNGMIPMDENISDFKAYIDSHDRAILSARYGDGKSTFLNIFQRKYSEDYIFLTIYPLHYQVTENQDVFECLKRDILLQLLSYIELKEEYYGNSLMLYSFLTKDPIETIKNIIGIVPDATFAGVSTSLIKSPLLHLINNFRNFKDYKTKIEEDGYIIEKYIESFESQKGSIYEFDLITQLICGAVKQIQETQRDKNNSKKIVLVVEDLDRMDPAHIFRILNIISCHVDRTAQGAKELEITACENKFLFDKILLVCDYNNIRSIFHHFYGANTDFKGYISKFSTMPPFIYSLKEQYVQYITTFFDDDLSQYPTLMHVIATCIIARTKNEESIVSSLREIRNRLNSEYMIKKTLIHTRNNNLKINTLNPLTKVLDILNRFSIGWREFVDDVNVYNANNEFYKMIGVCWFVSTKSKSFLIPSCDGGVFFYHSQAISDSNGRILLARSPIIISIVNEITNFKLDMRIFENINDHYHTSMQELLNSTSLIAKEMKKYVINCSILSI